MIVTNEGGLLATIKKIFSIKNLFMRTLITEVRMKSLWTLFEKTGHPLWYMLYKKQINDEEK